MSLAKSFSLTHFQNLLGLYFSFEKAIEIFGGGQNSLNPPPSHAYGNNLRKRRQEDYDIVVLLCRFDRNAVNVKNSTRVYAFR